MSWARRIVNCLWRFQPEPLASSNASFERQPGKALTCSLRKTQSTYPGACIAQLSACEPLPFQLLQSVAQAQHRQSRGLPGKRSLPAMRFSV
jgi:hypothetical protein